MLATLSTSRTERLLADGVGLPVALTGGYHLAFGIGAGLVLVGIAVAASVLKREPALRLRLATEDEPSADQVADSCAA